MDILIYTLKSIAFILTDVYSMIFLIMLGVFLYRQNKKTCIMQKMIIGEGINSPFELTMSQIVMGIFGGVVASLIMAYLGVMFYQGSAIYILFLISILLMFWNPRLICFSYSAAILGFVSIVSSYMAQIQGVDELAIFKVDITALMSMVAILHFVEGLLIMVDGSRGAIPVFAERENKIIGGFILKRYWSLPIALFIILTNNVNANIGSEAMMPNWWPIIRNNIPKNIFETSILTLISFYGVLGYNSVTFTKSKEKKAITSGLWIILYSILLFIVAQLANLNIYFKIFAVIFAPLVHELILNFQRYMEAKNKPRYISEGKGIMVLEVAPNSIASQIGIESGDLLFKINNIDLKNEKDIKDIISQSTMSVARIKITIKKRDGYTKNVYYNEFSRDSKLGLVCVPKYIPKEKIVVKYAGTSFSDVLNKEKNKHKEDGNNE